MQSSNSAVHNGIWVALSHTFTMLAGFASSILIVRSLAPESYGTYSYFVWLASILSALGSLWFPNALTKFISELRRQGRPGTVLKLIRWTGAVLFLLNLMIVSTVVLLLAFNSGDSRIFLLIAGAIPLINVFIAIPTTTLLGFGRFRPLSVATLAGGLVHFALVILVFTQGWGVFGYLAAVLSMNLMLAIALSLLQIRGIRNINDTPKNGPEPIRRGTMQPLLAFALPAALYHTAFNALLWQRPEVFFLERLSTLEQVGFYNLAFTLFNILVVLGWALTNSRYPVTSRSIGTGDWSTVRHRIDQGLLLGFAFAVPVSFVAFATLERAITTIYGAKMLSSVPITTVLMLGLIPSIAAGLMGVALYALRRSWLVVAFSTAVAVIKVGLIFLLIPRFGALGAAWSATLTVIAALLLEYLILHRLFTIRLPWRSLSGLVIIGAATSYLLPLLTLRLIPGLPGLALSIVVATAAYLLALWHFSYLEKLNLVLISTDPQHLRILHILGDRVLLPDPYSSGASGVVRAVLEIAQGQAAHGHDVWVAAVGTETFNVRWRGVTLVSFSRVAWAKFRIGKRTVDFRSHINYVLLTISRPFDVIHGHFHNYLRLLRARIRVAHFHGDPFHQGEPHEHIAFKDTDFRLIGRTTDVQIGISRFVSKQLEVGLKSRGNIHTISNGVDIESFDPVLTRPERWRWREAWGVGNDDVVIMFAGMVTSGKGPHLLAEAFATLYYELPHIHLVMAGSGNLWHHLQPPTRPDETPVNGYTELVERTLEPVSERVQLLGKRTADEMPGIYAASDILVVPSIWQEGFGLVCIEALASGLPVIASNTGGIPETVTVQNGRLFESGNVGELTSLVRQLATNTGLRASLAAAARPSVLQMTWERVSHQVTDLYRDVMASKILRRSSPIKDDHASRNLAA